MFINHPQLLPPIPHPPHLDPSTPTSTFNSNSSPTSTTPTSHPSELDCFNQIIQNHVSFSNLVPIIPIHHDPPDFQMPFLSRQSTCPASLSSPATTKRRPRLRLATRQFSLPLNRSATPLVSPCTPPPRANSLPNPRSIWEQQKLEIELDDQFIPSPTHHLTILLPAITRKPSPKALRHEHQLRLERWRLNSGGKGCLKPSPPDQPPIIPDALRRRLVSPALQLSTNTALNSIPLLPEPAPRLARCHQDWAAATANTPVASSQPTCRPPLRGSHTVTAPAPAPPKPPIPDLVAAAAHEPPGSASPTLALPPVDPPPSKPTSLKARLALLAKRLRHPMSGRLRMRSTRCAPTPVSEPAVARASADEHPDVAIGPRLHKSPTPMRPRLPSSKLALAASSVPDLRQTNPIDHDDGPLIGGGMYLHSPRTADSHVSLVTNANGGAEEEPTRVRIATDRWDGLSTVDLQPCCKECLRGAEEGSKEGYVPKFSEGAARLFVNRTWFLEDLLRERGICLGDGDGDGVTNNVGEVENVE